MSGVQQLLMAGDDGFVLNRTISSNTANFNLRSTAIDAGWDQVKPLKATLTVNAGIYLYASSTGNYALNASGSFPAGSNFTVVNNGYIVGCGGVGATSQSQALDWGDSDPNSSGCVIANFWNYGAAGAGNGGPAMIVSLPTSITNNGVIGGGGGGGGSGSAGGIDPSDGRGPRGWYPGGGGGGGQSFQAVSGGGAAYFKQATDWSFYLGWLRNHYGCEDVYAWAGDFASSPGGSSGSGSAGTGGAGATRSFATCYAYGGQGGGGGSWGATGNAGSAGGGTHAVQGVGCGTIYNQIAGSAPGAGGACLVGNSNVTWAVTGNRYGAIS